MIKTGGFQRGIDRLEDLRAQVVGGEWVIDEFNDPGHLIVLIDNLLYRTTELQQAEAENGL